jgi:hypothetical protein
VNQAQAAGWRVEKGQGGHWRLYPADPSKPLVVLPDTPGGTPRSMRNYRALLRRAGLDVDL